MSIGCTRSVVAPLINRTYRHVEQRWLAEFLGARYPRARVFYEKKLTVPIHPYSAEAGGRNVTTNSRRIVAKLDGWIEFEDHFEAWEAKQYANFGAVSQLEQYKELLGSTYEGQNHVNKPVSWHLLASHEKPEVKAAAESRGIEYNVYLPQWLRTHQIQVIDEGIARRAAFNEKIHGNPQT